MGKRGGKISNLRKSVRGLQEIPFVLSALVIANNYLETMQVSGKVFTYTLYAAILYVTARLYFISRRHYGIRWARILYINLFLLFLVRLLSEIFDFGGVLGELCEYTLTLFMAGVVASFATYIYDKYNYNL